MATQEKPKWRTNSDKLTAEFTSGQLVIAICVSLFFMLTCFLLGVLVGKYDHSLKTPGTVVAGRLETQPPAPSDTSSAPPADNAARDSGAQTYPRTDALTRQTNPAAPSPYTRREERSGPRITELPPLPSKRETPPAPEPPIKVAKEPSAQETTPPAPQPPAIAQVPLTPIDPPMETMPPGSAGVTPPAVAAPPAEAKPVPPTAPEKPAPPAVEKPAVKGKFGIQVAAFSGSTRKQKADECLKTLKANPEWGAQLVSVDDGKYYRVMIKGFPERAAANAACTALRQKPGFSDAFVRPMP